MKKASRGDSSVSSVLRAARGESTSPVLWSNTLRARTRPHDTLAEENVKVKAFDELLHDLFGTNTTKKATLDSAAARLDRMQRKKAAALRRRQQQRAMPESARFAAPTASSKSFANAKKTGSRVPATSGASTSPSTAAVRLPNLTTSRGVDSLAKKSATKAAKILRYMMNTEARSIREDQQAKKSLTFLSMPWLQSSGDDCPGHFCDGEAFCPDANGVHAVTGRQIILFQMSKEGRKAMTAEEEDRQENMVEVCLQCAKGYAKAHRKRTKQKPAVSPKVARKRRLRVRSKRLQARKDARASVAEAPNNSPRAHPQSPRVRRAARAAANRKSKAKLSTRPPESPAPAIEVVQPSTPKNVTYPQQKQEPEPVFCDDRMAQLHPEAAKHTAPDEGAPEQQSFACTICDCTEFMPNPFLRNRCNNCAHGIDCHRAPT